MTALRPRALIVDDKAATRGAVARMLRARYDIFESDDGAGAIARVKSGEQFDVILLDVEMPIVDGAETFRRISIVAPELAERVIFLTGGSRDPDTQEWLESLDEGRVLWKPVGAADLKRALEELPISKKPTRMSRRPSKGPSLGKIPKAEHSKRRS